MPKSPSQPPLNNPPVHGAHAQAAGAYAHHAKETTLDPREIEARALLKAVQKMQELQNRWPAYKLEEIDDVLRHNRQIWMLFVDNAISDDSPGRPTQLRNNIANLGAYVFKRTLDILADPQKDKFNVLIDINREIAAGLMTKPKTE
jgi:flagellar protein FlaF